MTDKKPDGGPAFPLDGKRDIGRGLQGNYAHFDGLTKRQYYAAKALQGLLARVPDGNSQSYEMWAAMSFKYADTMIEAEEK